jgi:hypothetical protein
MTEASITQATLTDDVARVRKAYEELLEEIRAVPEEQVLQINIDIPSAVTSVLGALPEIMALRPRMVGLAEFSIAQLDKLGKYAMAMDHANTVHLMQSKSATPVAELVKRCERTREVLLADANTAVVRGLVDGSSLKELRGVNSYRNLVFDVFALAYLMRSNWSKLEGKTALTLVELLEAEQLADQLNVALGLREQGPAVTGPAAEIRSRAYTLFMQAYKAVRRAVQYLEPERVDQIMPSIRVPRGPSKRQEESEPQSEAPAAPAATDTANAREREPAAAAPVDVPAGMPGASPFVRN